MVAIMAYYLMLVLMNSKAPYRSDPSSKRKASMVDPSAWIRRLAESILIGRDMVLCIQHS